MALDVRLHECYRQQGRIESCYSGYEIEKDTSRVIHVIGKCSDVINPCVYQRHVSRVWVGGIRSRVRVGVTLIPNLGRVFHDHKFS